MIDPHKGRDLDRDIDALHTLYNAGAFLITCTKDKRPARKVKDPETGEWNRHKWAEIETHYRNGGYVGYYAPGEQGLLVLDFDPMVPEWLDDVADALGAPPLEWWHSSGKVKPAKDGKPEGYGGHAVWKARKEMSTQARHFSYITDGIPLGEIFSGHKGYYFIVYNPTALIDALDVDDIECVNPADIPPAARPNGGGANYTEDWAPDQNSRHDSTVSAVASAAYQFDKRERFAAELDKIRDKFIRSLEVEQKSSGRDVEGEWNRIAQHGWVQWDKDRAREAEERQAIQGKASKDAPEGIQEALAMAQFDKTKIAIANIAKKTGERAQPAIPMIKAIRVVADNISIPDINANNEVEALLKAGEAMGVSLTEIVNTRGKYLNEWRTANKVRMHLGDFPLCSISLTGMYGTKSEAETAIKASGGVAMPTGFQCRSSDEVMAALRATGVNIVWSELDTCLTLQHDGVGEWKLPAKCTPPDFPRVMQLQKGLIRSVMTTKKCQDPTKTDENGKPLVKWRAVPVMVNEMNAKSFVSKMLGQIGNEIPRVDYTIELTKRVMAYRDTLSQEERDECVRLASNWLLEIPYVRVVDAERNAKLAQVASRIVYAVFFHRRRQFMGDFVKPYSQRYVPVFGGAKRVGKTTIAKHLFPSVDVFKGRIEPGFAWDSDDNNMKRKVSGKLLVINDEMAGVRSAKADRVKSFITWSDGAYHEKFKNYEDMVRSDVLVATANQSNDIPSDAALRDRFLFINMEAVEGYSDKERYDGIVKWFADHYNQLLVGGLIMAEENVDLNPPAEIEDMRADAVVALDSSNNSFNDAIMSIVEQGLYSKEGTNGPIVSLCLVALHAGLLKYQRDVISGDGGEAWIKHRQGSIIRPSDGQHDPDFEWSEDVQIAFNVRRNERSQTGAITQIKDAIRTLHGDDALATRHHPPMIDGVRGAKFHGFEVMTGRLAKHWNTGGSSE